jgi:four helix bundle protein
MRFASAAIMPKLESFESRSFRFACKTIELYRVLLRRTDSPQALVRQFVKSGTSIGANLSEAEAAESRRDLRSKFAVALKEARETVYWLRLFEATASSAVPGLGEHLREGLELVAILTSAHKRLKPSDARSGSR